MKVLVATDGSEQSLKAVRWALVLAEKGEAKVTIMAVAPYAGDLGGMMYEMPAGTQEKLEDIARKNLAAAREIFDKKKVKVEAVVVEGPVPANVILEKAEEGKFDLVVMGSTGATGLRRALMGSTASKVVAYAPCSVSIIR